ncbi:hypothetical protein [Algoriphagus antarcticus]|uniref:Uncharacterized protein n=1 Tax=Algoriphagus antarcticus TaxID=238540 RepID=A0A3E0DX20_9BACT|nr:hypothetical protein [Algoriphagus antarcticus]REG87064.1 hypothetical protein C8N25_11143 [Algoriphagus antarcticus]
MRWHQSIWLDMVYTDIEVKDASDPFAHFISLKSLYVAESREKAGLVMVSDGNITSVPVTMSEDIISFPPFNFKAKDKEGNLLPDSVNLIDNNYEIKDMLGELAEKKVALPITTKIKPDMNPNENDPENNEILPVGPDTGKADTLTPEGKVAAGASVLTGMEAMIAVADMDLSSFDMDSDVTFENICN